MGGGSGRTDTRSTGAGGGQRSCLYYTDKRRPAPREQIKRERVRTNGMRWAFDLGSLFGIRIRIHYLFVLFVGFLVIRQAMIDVEQNTFGAPILLSFLLLLFGFVLLHELGHSLMALRFGIPVRDITLWPLGGIARLEKIPEAPRVELAIAIAGPAVNVAIVLILLPFSLVWAPDFWNEALTLRPTSVLSHCMLANLFMAGFNFIPAFPMDGGRVLRGLLGYRMDFVRATTIAVRVGRIFALSFIVFGALRGNPMLLLIGIFILLLGAHEERAVRWRAMLAAAKPSVTVIDEDGNPIDGTSSDTGGPITNDELEAAMREALARGDLDALKRILAARMARDSRDDSPA